MRTNEIAFDSPWELREFRLDAHNSGFLRQVTVKQTPGVPKPVFSNVTQAQIDSFIKTVTPSDVIAQRLNVPPRFPVGQAFLAGSAPTEPDFFVYGTQTETRSFVSLGTCNGCHGREAFPAFVGGNDPADANQPGHFTHVEPRNEQNVAQLSAFLTGHVGAGPAAVPFELRDPLDQPDPSHATMVRHRAFGDLEDRAHHLRDLVEFGTFFDMAPQGFIPRAMVH